MSKPLTMFGVAATCGENRDGDRHTLESLRKMAKQINERPCPVSWEFDLSRIVGKVSRAQVTRDGLEILADIDPETVPDNRGHLYATPAFRTLKATWSSGGKKRTLEDVDLMIFGLTRSPTDSNLKPLVPSDQDYVELGWALADLQTTFVEEAERLMNHWKRLLGHD